MKLDNHQMLTGAVALGIIVIGGWRIASLRAEIADLREQVEALQASAPSAPSARAPQAASRPSGQARAQRTLSPEERNAMRYELESGQGKKVWFVTAAGDSEAADFQRELQFVFQESGWEVGGVKKAAFPIKAGIYMFMADEEAADHVQGALRGLEATGLTVNAGRGYRDYYKSRKKEDPSWNGFELEPGQDFVIVVGPNPANS